MKKNFHYLLTVVVAVLTISCSQGFEEQDITPQVGEKLVPMTITVEGEATRTFVGEDGKSICWHEDDKIAVFEGTSSSNKTIREFKVVRGSVDGNSATFAGMVSENATKFFAIYPYQAVVERSGNYEFNINAATEQRLTGDQNVADGAIISLAYFTSTDTAISFKTAVGFLRVELTFDDVTSVVVNGTKLAGKAKIKKTTTSSAAPTISSISNAVGTVKLLPEGEVFTPGAYYIALLPGTTPAGEFSIHFNRKEGSNPTYYTSAKDITIERNKGFKTTDAKWEYTPFGPITDAQGLVNFLENCASASTAEFANDIDLEGVTLPTATSFAGVLDCKNFAIKNWNATAPLFETLKGSVKNLTIDSSCALTVANKAGAYGFVASTVDVNGSLENIVNNVERIDITTTAFGAGDDQYQDAVYFGTLAGKCLGTVKDCINNSHIAITTTPTGDNIRGVVYIGGVVGLVDTALDNCHNRGNISYTIGSGCRVGYTFIGGVAGGTTFAKYSSATDIVRTVANSTNTGTISHNYSGTAIAVGGGTNNSNYTYLAGVIGYCEGSVSGCINGEQNSDTKGSVTLTTPTLNTDYVIARTTVAGVAGFAMTGGADCINYAPIAVTGSFGPGNMGAGSSSYAGGGAAKGVSVAGVVAQTGLNTYYEGNTLSNCHNYGDVECNFNMADNTSTDHYVGGVVAYSSLKTELLSNNAIVRVNSLGKTNYFGGVLGYSKYGASTITNNGNIFYTLLANASTNQLSGNSYFGGVVGCVATSQEVKNATNNNPVVYTNNSSLDSDIFCGGVFGQAAITNTAVNNALVTINAGSTTGDIFCGGVIGDALGASDSLENNGDVAYSAATVATARVGGVIGDGATKLDNSTNNNKVSVAATSITTLCLGGVAGGSGTTTMTKNVNEGTVTTNAGTTLYMGGIVGNGTEKITASDCQNKATLTLNNANLEAQTIAVGGLCGLGYYGSTFTSSSNSANISLTAKSATTSYLAGITAMPSSASVNKNYATNAVDCTNTGNLYASFPATWYVGGAVAFGGKWASSSTYQFDLKQNTVSCDITIAATTTEHHIGGIVGHSGQHINISDNTYTGTISVSGSESPKSFVGGIIGTILLDATTANTKPEYYNYTFAGNSVNATLPSSGYVAAIVGGQYNSSTSTVKSAPIFRYIFDAVNPNTIASTSSTKQAVGTYRDDTRFVVEIEGLEDGVVVK